MSMAVNMALGTSVLLGFGALAMDIGYMNFALTQTQTAADSGALAGAISLQAGTPSTILSSAQTWGQSNQVGALAVVIDDADVRRGTLATGADCSAFVTSNTGRAVYVRAHTVGPAGFLSRIWGSGDLSASACAVAEALPATVCTMIGLGDAGVNGTAANIIGYDSTIDFNPANSPDGEGAVCSNANVDFSGKPTVVGNVRPGIGMVVDGDTSNVTGITTPLSEILAYPQPVLPNGLINMPASVVNSQGKVVGNKVIAPGNYRLTKDLAFVGTAKLTISPPGKVSIYSNGFNVEITGGGVVNTGKNPHSLAIYVRGDPSRPIKIAGNAAFYGYVYAPGAEVTINGTTAFYGAVVADQLTINGGGNTPKYMDTSLMTKVQKGGIRMIR